MHPRETKEVTPRHQQGMCQPHLHAVKAVFIRYFECSRNLLPSPLTAVTKGDEA